MNARKVYTGKTKVEKWKTSRIDTQKAKKAEKTYKKHSSKLNMERKEETKKGRESTQPEKSPENGANNILRDIGNTIVSIGFYA